VDEADVPDRFEALIPALSDYVRSEEVRLDLPPVA
jgi:hypothetical protein